MSEFDPSEHTVAEVLTYLEDHPEDHEDVIAAEKSGKNRAGIVGESVKVSGVVFDRVGPETGALEIVSN